MEKALEKRPVGAEAIDEAVGRILHKIRSLGEREIAARAVGELVMEELRHLDEVAFVRFASVYRHFQDIDAFREEIEKLRQHPRRRKTAERQGCRPRAAAAAARGHEARGNDPAGERPADDK